MDFFCTFHLRIRGPLNHSVLLAIFINWIFVVIQGQWILQFF